MSAKAKLWAVVMFIGIWLGLWKEELGLLGTIIVLLGAGFGLRERRKEKKDKL